MVPVAQIQVHQPQGGWNCAPSQKGVLVSIFPGSMAILSRQARPHAREEFRHGQCPKSDKEYKIRNNWDIRIHLSEARRFLLKLIDLGDDSPPQIGATGEVREIEYG